MTDLALKTRNNPIEQLFYAIISKYICIRAYIIPNIVVFLNDQINILVKNYID